MLASARVAEAFDGRDEGAADAGLEGGVACVGDHGEAGLGPGGGELEGGGGGADHVVAALDDLGGEMGDAVHVAEQAFGRQEQVVGEVVGLDAGEAEGGAVLGEGGDGVGGRQEGGAGALVDGPSAGGGLVDQGVRGGEESKGVAAVLDAAAWTYIAGFASSLLTLLFYVMQVMGMRRD